MKFRDFLLMMFVCFVWAVNVVVGKLVLSGMSVPPFYYAAIRFVLVAAMLSPLLRPIPRQIGRIATVGILVGAAHFGLLFLGLSASSPSSAAIVLQLGIPCTVLLSVVFLKEQLSVRRVAGLTIALAGVVLVIWNPEGMHASVGLIAVAGSTLSISLGSILLKKLDRIDPLRLQAWVGLVSWCPLAFASLLLEHGQLETSLAGGWHFIAALVFSVVFVTAWAHTSYFSLLQRYDANLIAPLTLAMPVMTILLGVAITGDEVTMRTAIGSLLTLAGVVLILMKRRDIAYPQPGRLVSED